MLVANEAARDEAEAVRQHRLGGGPKIRGSRVGPYNILCTLASLMTHAPAQRDTRSRVVGAQLSVATFGP